jgi:flagellar motor switch protein FliM
VPVEPLSRALQTQRVVLDGVAGEAELALEDLTTLAVGDVIKLNRRISEPLQLCIRGGGVVCAARLGASKGRTALQLT